MSEETPKYTDTNLLDALNTENGFRRLRLLPTGQAEVLTSDGVTHVRNTPREAIAVALLIHTQG